MARVSNLFPDLRTVGVPYFSNVLWKCGAKSRALETETIVVYLEGPDPLAPSSSVNIAGQFHSIIPLCQTESTSVPAVHHVSE